MTISEFKTYIAIHTISNVNLAGVLIPVSIFSAIPTKFSVHITNN